MTVCIAAVCDTAFIVGACDHLLTFGDLVTLDSSVSKIWKIGTHAVSMMAGDASLATEVMQKIDLTLAFSPPIRLSRFLRWSFHFKSTIPKFDGSV